ncbi:MAG: hypothetical protein NZ750_04130 [Anaerolineae bacterium]|nr:hypothetical protein [Anaerolineae bacterium]MDW8171509.1 hypothetical protein [Anaerolineae bacterium]
MAQRSARRGSKPAEEERDLRALIEDEEEDDSALPNLAGSIVIEDDEDDGSAASSGRQRRSLFGLSPMERAFLAVMLFLNVLILGAGILIVTGRIVF